MRQCGNRFGMHGGEVGHWSREWSSSHGWFSGSKVWGLIRASVVWLVEFDGAIACSNVLVFDLLLLGFLVCWAIPVNCLSLCIGPLSMFVCRCGFCFS